MTLERTKDVVGLLAIAAVGTLIILWLVSSKARRSSLDPMASVPQESFLVATIDVRELARSPIGAALVGTGEPRADGLLDVNSIQKVCGFDPLPHLRKIAVAVPPEELHGDFGVVATGDLTPSMLQSCAEALSAKRGGHTTTRTRGSFTVMSDERPESASLAFRPRGPFLVGRGAWLDEMIDAADGHARSLGDGGDSTHQELRAMLELMDLDARAILVSAVLPRSVRDQIRRDIEDEYPEAAKSGQAGQMSESVESVLGVSGVSIGLHPGASSIVDGKDPMPGVAQDETRIVFTARCETTPACKGIETLLLHARLGWSGDLRLRLLGLGALIDNLSTRAVGGSFRAQTHVSADELAGSIRRLLRGPLKPETTGAPGALPGGPSSGPNGAFSAQDAGPPPP